jgi:hypothetical protein
MRFDITMEGIDATIKGLDLMSAQVQAGAVSAVNKLASQGVTASVRAINASYNIKAAAAKKGVRLYKAVRAGKSREGRLYATIIASGRSMPLLAFGAIPAGPKSQKGIPRFELGQTMGPFRSDGDRRRAAKLDKAGQYPGRKRVSAKVLRGGRREKFRHAFVARMPSGHIGLFERTEGRAIREMHSVGIARMFEALAVRELERLMREKGPVVLKHELDYALGRIRKKGK